MCAFAFCEIAGLPQDEAIVPMNSGRGLRVPSSISRPQHGKNSAISVLRYQLDPDSNKKKKPTERRAVGPELPETERETY